MRLHLLTLTDDKHQITKHIIKSLTNHLKVQLIINSEFHEFNESLKNLFKQRLNKSVNKLMYFNYLYIYIFLIKIKTT